MWFENMPASSEMYKLSISLKRVIEEGILINPRSIYKNTLILTIQYLTQYLILNRVDNSKQGKPYTANKFHNCISTQSQAHPDSDFVIVKQTLIRTYFIMP